MISESGRYPVDGGLERGPEGEAQRLVRGVSHAAARPDGFTGGVRQLEVSIDCLEEKHRTRCEARVRNGVLVACTRCVCTVSSASWSSCKNTDPQTPA